jgi:integrase/recombinase XerD
MFDQIFQWPSVIARHARAPYAKERARYLKHLLERGYAHHSVQRRAFELLWIARKLKRAYGRLDLAEREVQIVAHDWRSRSRAYGRPVGTPRALRYCLSVAYAWLRFLGALPTVPIPFRAQLDAYCRWAREERGLSEASITGRRQFATGFLRWFGASNRQLSSLRIHDIDAYLADGAKRGWKRVSVYDVAQALRAFFRYGAAEGFSPAQLPALIRGPRLYAQEGLPQGPQWTDVERLFATLDPRCPKDVRDRPILMLFTFYGLRRSEVVRLRLEDIDWEHDLLHVSRAKGGGRQTYPLSASLGNAFLQYLKTVRPASNERALFLTFTSPPRPASIDTLYYPVAKRLRALGVELPHLGPHCLRHACATHLLAKGVSMKIIADQLGHHGVRATRTYAKVDLAQLREVGAFDLGELS